MILSVAVGSINIIHVNILGEERLLRGPSPKMFSATLFLFEILLHFFGRFLFLKTKAVLTTMTLHIRIHKVSVMMSQ